MLCYTCLMLLKDNVTTITWSYKDSLGATHTGTCTGLTDLVGDVLTLVNVVGITGATAITYKDSTGKSMGVTAQTMVRGVALCAIHAVDGIFGTG